MADLLKKYVLFSWDECTMSNKKTVEAINKNLRDFIKNMMRQF